MPGGRIPQTFIDDLLSRIDIVDVISEYLPLKKAGRNHQALCPFHHEKTPSFTVNREKQFFYCFGCGASGSVIGFLKDYAHLDFVEVVTQLAARAGMPLPQVSANQPKGDSLEPVYEILKRAQGFYAAMLRQQPIATPAVDYLKRRGLNGVTAKEFGLGYAPSGWDNLMRALGKSASDVQLLERAGLLVARESGGHYDRFRERIMFPIHDSRGRIIGFGGRVLDQGEPKYLNSPETPVFHKGRELYGLYRIHQARHRPARVIVVEGYMDVLALAQHGVHNVVATLGTATTGDHLERLFRLTPEIVFCFDGDDAGQRAAWRALKTSLPYLLEGRHIGYLFLPQDEDPDSLVRKDGAGFFEDAQRIMPLSEFFFTGLTQQVNLGSIDGRARLAELAKPLLSKVPSGPFQQLMLQRLTELSGFEANKSRPVFEHGGHVLARGQHGMSSSRMPRPSLVKKALTSLMRRPELALGVESPELLAHLELPGVPLLIEMIELIQTHPDISLPAILERWQGSPYGVYLTKLAMSDLPASGEQIEAEFRSTLLKLGKMLSQQNHRKAILQNPLSNPVAPQTFEVKPLGAHNGVINPFSKLTPQV
jgi:DNA primase